jgi:drug/metabolite transporter (DMT)-like permease
MKKALLFCIISLVLCLSIGTVVAAESVQADTPQGILKLPENVSIELISPERGTLMLTEKNGQVELPQGKYRLESWTLERKDDQGRMWKLSGDLMSARTVEVGPEPTVLDIKTEPIVCNLDVNAGPETMNFTLGLNGSNGERLRVSGDAPGVKPDQLPQPTFVIYNEDRSFEKSYDFQSQCCGNYRFNWTPPAGVEGPFFFDIKVAGPFKIDFKPLNISQAHEVKIAAQQATHKKKTRQVYVIGLCYAVVLAIIVGVLARYRESIGATSQEDRGKRVIKRLVWVLAVFVLVLMLNPLYSLFSGDCKPAETIAESVLVGGLLAIGALLVWGVRKVRTKWPFVTIMLYGIIFVFLLVPVLTAVFLIVGHPDTNATDIGIDEFGDFYGWLFKFSDYPEVPITWAVILGLFAVQACLLIVPVRIKHQRPKQHRGIWFTAIIAALLFTVLLFAAGLSIMAAVWGDDISEPVFWVLIGILPLNWIGWSIVFCLFSRSMEPDSFIRRLMRWLIGGSILELLIAVPSHIIIRHRDVCCAHGLTAAGLTTGIAVIFFAFGPGLYFLYADRIRSKQPHLPSQEPSEEPTLNPPQ